jgi:hypothetical protein
VLKLVQVVLGLAILFALPVDSWGQFQTPPAHQPPVSRHRISPPPPQAETAQPQTAQPQTPQPQTPQPQTPQPQTTDERGTEKSPLVVTTLKSNEEIAKDNQDRRYRAYNTYAMMSVGAAIAILALLQLATFVVMIRTSRSQSRAYVQVDSVKVFNAMDDKTGPSIAHVVIKNFGQTPAHKVTTASQFAFEKYPPPSTLNLVISDKEFSAANHSRIRLAPGQAQEIVEVANRPPLNEQERRALLEGGSAIFVYGEIRFTDVFGRNHRSRYRYILGGPVGVRSGGSLVAWEDGNDAS